MLEKYRSDIYACHRCGLCRAKYSDEVRYVCPIREHTGGFEYSFARGRIQIAKGILENRLPYSGSLVDVIYKCLLCGNCRELCGKKDPVTGTWIIDHTAIFKAIREDIVSLGLMPHVHKKIDSSIKKHYELYKEPHVN
ncbi:MAG: (Fe-S)-binding protein, partial [Thermodesulfobacteriota bacterium]|nr:(Fe-S)-binding protein [Thermodesulfobacteriota bacterium]